MKLYKMIEIYLKYDNMHTFGIINTFICINNHVNSCINSMLSVTMGALYRPQKFKGRRNDLTHEKTTQKA